MTNKGDRDVSQSNKCKSLKYGFHIDSTTIENYCAQDLSKEVQLKKCTASGNEITPNLSKVAMFSDHYGVEGSVRTQQSKTTNESATSAMKSYKLILPSGLYAELEAVAKNHHCSVVSIMRKCLQIGLIAIDANDDPNKSLILRDGESEMRLVFV